MKGPGTQRTRRRRATLSMKVARLGGLCLMLAAGTTLAALPAAAHRSPANCTANNLTLDIARDKTLVRNGDTINYTVIVANPMMSGGFTGCDVSGVTITFTAPAPDGTASGAKTVLATNANYPAGAASAVAGTVPYKVEANPGVSSLEARVDTNVYTLHDIAADTLHQGAFKSLSTLVTQPETVLSTSVSPTGGQAPLVVTFTYTEKNTSPTTQTVISGVTLTDAACSPIKLVGGDTNGNGKLDVGETWTYTCSRALTTAGTVTSQVKATGTDQDDQLAAPDETASVSVTVTPPPAPKVTPKPTASVLGTSFSKKPILPVTGTNFPLGPLGLAGVGLLVTGAAVLRRSRVRP